MFRVVRSTPDFMPRTPSPAGERTENAVGALNSTVTAENQLSLEI